MVVNARTIGMCVMWCSVLHEVQLFVTLRVRNSAQQETVEHLQIVTVIGFAGIVVWKTWSRHLFEQAESNGTSQWVAHAVHMAETGNIQHIWVGISEGRDDVEKIH